jgi:predicted nucleic acid-binding protein
MTRVNVFYDSDVVSSGCATTKGYHSAARSLLVIAAAGLVQGVVSEQVVQEVKKVLSIELVRHLPEANQVFHELIEGFFKVVPDPTPSQVQPFISQVTDPDDAPILASAILSGCKVLVTFNTRHYLKAVGILVMRPEAFLELMRKAIYDAVR